MNHFALALKGQNIFGAPLGTCAIPAPSLSIEPTASPAPTAVLSPSCESTGLVAYVLPPARQFVNFNRYTNGGRNKFEVDHDCTYIIYGGVLMVRSPTLAPSPGFIAQVNSSQERQSISADPSQASP